MKLFYSTIFTLFVATNSIAQISIDESDMSVIGDVIVRYNDTIPTYGPGGSGPNQVWDFSQAIADETVTTTVSAPSSTPYQSDFSGSNLAMSGGASSYAYFTQNTNQLITDGAAGDLLGTGDIVVAVFDDELTLHNFPRVYADHHDDTYSFVAETDGAPWGVEAIRLHHNGHAYDTTDAYGTLITPTGTYDVIRVKTVDYTIDVIDVQITIIPIWTNAFITTSDTVTSYTWHAKHEKMAIAEFTYDSIGNPKRFTYSSVPPLITVGTANAVGSLGSILYPQPATDKICVDRTQNETFSYQIFNIQGLKIQEGISKNDCIQLDGLKLGLFILRISNDDGVMEEPLKFVVSG